MSRGLATARLRGALAAIILLSGCATDPFGSVSQNRRNLVVELQDTAFFPQDDYQCGPAALATLLEATGVSVLPGVLTPQLYIPERGGSLQSEIVAASRRYERLPYVIEPRFGALLGEIDGGRPVLVLQNLGVSFAPAWHYAVVVGYSVAENQIILRSGTTRRQVMSARTFLRTWKRSDNWGIVLLRADDIPPTVDKHRFLRTVAAAEASGHLQLALAAYSVATARWPDEPLAWLGTGNTYFALGDPDAAERSYRRMLAVRPADAIGSNNLASLLIARGACEEAGELIRNAQGRLPDTSPYRPILDESEVELADCHGTGP